MGNKPQGKQQKAFDMSSIYKEYTPAYQAFQANSNFLSTDQLMPQVPTFAKNLTKLFPRADHTFKAFFQMAMYLRREEKKFQINEHAIKTGPISNLLDRFFIITLNIPAETYNEKSVTIQELDEIFIEYFRIFVADPEKGSIQKLLKFMGRTEKSFILKSLTQDIRDYFPNIIRYLKDYYALKFKKLQKKGHLLENFNSKIIKNDAILLSLRLPRLVEPEIICLYNTEDYGLSFHSIEKQLVGYTGPWLMIAYHSEKNLEGEKQNYIFGSYQNGPIRDVSNYQGDLTGFIFTLHPTINFFSTDKGEGDSKYFYLNTIQNERFNKRRGIGYGGNEDHKQFKLWIDEDIDRSTCFNGRDLTYGFGTLAGPGTEKLNIRKLEFWGLGHKYNYQDQKKYWQERQIDIMKRRKVDKKQFISTNAELFFQKTFEHRGQVYGEIEKREQKKKEDK